MDPRRRSPEDRALDASEHAAWLGWRRQRYGPTALDLCCEPSPVQGHRLGVEP